MARATVDKKVLDTLIRAKLATLNKCGRVRPLPVRWQAPDESGLNWTVSGWTGENGDVKECADEMGPYLALLHANFRIPPPSRAA